ncbi:MAG TPA: hypothetical protein VNS55_05030 [Nocardioides sp.]|nr:hypothetical protein [Nocardioides sp.]
MSQTQKFPGYSDNRYQHTMHTLAWWSLIIIIVLGVGAGIFGFIWGLGQ